MLKLPDHQNNHKNKKPKKVNNEPCWLDRVERRNHSHFGRRPSIRERNREQAIQDWMGPDMARRFMLDHQRQAEHIGKAMGEVLASIGMRRQALLEEIMDNWPDLVGADIARISNPCRLFQKQLEIEVENPSWFYILQTTHAKVILQRVKDFSNDAINQIRFVPGGRHHSAFNK